MQLNKFSIVFYALLIFWIKARFVDALVGGFESEIGQFKYQATLMINKNIICGGAIINDEHILTAAHCVLDKYNNFETSKILVLVGVTKNIKENSYAFEVDTVYVHVNYKFNVELFKVLGDIAVLKLRNSLNLNKNINILQKLKIPEINDNKFPLFVGEEPLISGCGSYFVRRISDSFGRTVFIAGPPSNELKFAHTKVVDNFRCSIMYMDTIHQSNLCSQTKQHNSLQSEGVCEGDSGGPLVINGDTIIGVLSNAPSSCNEKSKTAVYTRVTSFSQFIIDAMNGVQTNEMRVHHYKN